LGSKSASERAQRIHFCGVTKLHLCGLNQVTLPAVNIAESVAFYKRMGFERRKTRRAMLSACTGLGLTVWILRGAWTTARGARALCQAHDNRLQRTVMDKVQRYRGQRLAAEPGR